MKLHMYYFYFNFWNQLTKISDADKRKIFKHNQKEVLIFETNFLIKFVVHGSK